MMMTLLLSLCLLVGFAIAGRHPVEKPLTCRQPSDTNALNESFGSFTVAYVIGAKERPVCFYILHQGSDDPKPGLVVFSKKVGGKTVKKCGWFKTTPSNTASVEFFDPSPSVEYFHFRYVGNGISLAFGCQKNSKDQVIIVAYDKEFGDLSKEATEVARALSDNPEPFKVDLTNCTPFDF